MSDFVFYNDIKGDYENSWYIPYDKLLSTIEWRNFRKRILERDNYECLKCNKKQSEKIGDVYFRTLTASERQAKLEDIIVIDILGDGEFVSKSKPPTVTGVKLEHPTILHVHHKFYIYGNLPWDYEIDSLLTVCHECHKEIHKTERIKVYSDNSLNQAINLTPCIRCNGTGFLDEYHYFQNGICFRCSGRKFDEFIK